MCLIRVEPPAAIPARRSSMTLVVDEEEEAAQWRKEAGLVRSGKLFGGHTVWKKVFHLIIMKVGQENCFRGRGFGRKHFILTPNPESISISICCAQS
jgi:hypothetical protein